MMRRIATALALIATAFSLSTAIAVSAHADESPAPGGQPGNNQQGTPPTLVIKAGALTAGQPSTITITPVGGDVPQDGMSMSVSFSLSVDNGTVSAAGGGGGSSASVTMAYGASKGGVNFTVTPERAGTMNVKAGANPVDKPQEGIGSSASFDVAAGAPSPSPTPSQAPVASTAASAAPTAAAPKPSTAPVIAPAPEQRQGKAPNLPTYDPTSEPEQVVNTTVTAVAVIGVVGVSAAAVAGTSIPMGGATPTHTASPAPSGGGSSGGGSPGGGSTPGGTRDASRDIAAERRHDEMRAARHAGEVGPRDQASLANIDAAGPAEASAGGVDRARALMPPLTAGLDLVTVGAATRIASWSPLTTRLLIDNAYLRALFGSLALLLPIAGIVIGVLAGLQVHGVAVAPAVTLLGLIAFLGTLDAATGLLALIAFSVVVVVSGGVVSADSIRTLLGLLIIGCGPALIAGAARPIRRPAGQVTGWERLTDFVVIPLLGGFAAQGMVRALPGLSGYQMPIAESANTIAVIVIAGLLARVTLEELVARTYPARLAAAMPAQVAVAGVPQRIVVAVIRTLVFLFVAIAFIGNTWQLWFGAALFAATQAFDILSSRMPNSPRLYQALPGGLPKIIVILLVSLGVATLLSLVLGDDPDLARTSFALLIVPGFVLSGLGMFGRAPAPGDTRWYLRDSMRTIYRIGGILMLAAGIYLTQFAA